MWKKNPLGASEQTLTKQQRPRSWWAPHPKTGETVWYDAEKDTYRDKFKGPARNALSIGWKAVGGKRAENAAKLLIKGGKKVVPAVYKWDKKGRETEKEFDKKVLTSTGNLLKSLLVSKTSPSVMGYKDATGITKGKNQVIEDTKILNKEASTPTPKVENTANNSKKKNEELAIRKKNNVFADIGFE